MPLDLIIEFMKSDETIWSSLGDPTFNIPFQVKPYEYLYFAEQDLKNRDPRE